MAISGLPIVTADRIFAEGKLSVSRDAKPQADVAQTTPVDTVEISAAAAAPVEQSGESDREHGHGRHHGKKPKLRLEFEIGDGDEKLKLKFKKKLDEKTGDKLAKKIGKKVAKYLDKIDANDATRKSVLDRLESFVGEVRSLGGALRDEGLSRTEKARFNYENAFDQFTTDLGGILAGGTEVAEPTVAAASPVDGAVSDPGLNPLAKPLFEPTREPAAVASQPVLYTADRVSISLDSERFSILG